MQIFIDFLAEGCLRKCYKYEIKKEKTDKLDLFKVKNL